MTEAQCDMAFKLVSELSIYATASDQYGNARMAACMRNAASLLAKMLEEAEQLKPALQHLRAHQAAHGEGDESDV